VSERDDVDRREASREARIETGKEQLRLGHQVLAARTDGLTRSETARRIGCCRKTVWKLYLWLGDSVEVGKAQLRQAQLVLTAYAEGLSIEQTAARMGETVEAVYKFRVWLGVQLGSYSRGGQSRRTLQAVRP
jgi:DNA-directed RNA polymerase specialized sigma24 family protein